VVRFENRVVGIAERLEQRGGLLDVGEQKGDYTRRQEYDLRSVGVAVPVKQPGAPQSC
jgi:hypothetical protein